MSIDGDRVSLWRVIAGDRFYRGATAAMFIQGFGYSAAAPLIGIHLVRNLDASLGVAGLFYLTNLAAPVAGYLVGARSDRTGKRLGLFRWSAVATFIGWLLIASAQALWVPFAASVLLLAFASATGSQLFAALRDEMDARPGPRDDAIVAVVRMALTAGWVVGPVFGTWLASQYGVRTLLVVTAVLHLVQILPLGLQRTAPPRTTRTDLLGALPARPSLAIMAPLLAFTGLYVLAYAGEPIKYAYLPIRMADQLQLPAALSGAVIAVQPLIEFIIMPFSVLLARRFGYLPVMVVAALCGVAANLCFAFTDGLVGLFLGQGLMGAVWGIFAALGIIVAQKLLPSAVATASAIFMSAVPLGSAVGGLGGGLGVTLLGLPLVFLVPAGCALIAAVGLAVLSRSAATRALSA